MILGFILIPMAFAYGGVVQLSPEQKNEQKNKQKKQIQDIEPAGIISTETTLTAMNMDNYTASWNNPQILRGELHDYSVNPHKIRNLIFQAPLLAQDQKQVLKSLQSNGFVDLTVGSFLDELHDSPALRSFYFTSKELNFTLRSKIANYLNNDIRKIAFSEIDHDPFDPRRMPQSRGRGALPLEEVEFTPAQKAFRASMMDEIFESLGGFIFTILALLGILFLTMRYVLIKYI